MTRPVLLSYVPATLVASGPLSRKVILLNSDDVALPLTLAYNALTVVATPSDAPVSVIVKSISDVALPTDVAVVENVVASLAAPAVSVEVESTEDAA